MKPFPLARVALLDGPLARAVRTDLEYVLAMDPDRLLAPFLREAGLRPRAASYGNWEDSGLDGHIGGHYLSALALLAVVTGEPEPRRRLDHMVGELERAQEALGTGYVGGVPGGAALFESLRHGGVEAARSLGSSSHWVPWYNLHKTFAGLIDAHRLLGHDRALAVVLRLADWWLDIAATMDDDAFEAMLDTEFGGMNEAFADLAALTGREAYADMALRFSHRAVLDPLLERRDALTGRHANTQIPKAVGYAATAAVRGDRDLHEAARFFWREVVERRTVAIGGNSVREHFHAVDDFSHMIEDREGPETCNTYNMLELTKALAEASFEPAHLDFAERAILNHQLPSQHPERGGFVYFTPMRPRHYRVYSQPELGMWCCVGTGIEAQAKYGEWVFGEHEGALAVNLFVPALLDAPDFGGRFRIETAFPADEHVRLACELDGARAFPLRLRVPGWTEGLTDLAVNGDVVAAEQVPGAVLIERTWEPGDVVTFRLPLRLRAERLPDGSPWQAYFAGPVLLAARDGDRDLTGLLADDSRMGHVARGPLLGFADVPVVEDLPADEVLTREGPLRFRLATADPVGGVELVPFHDVHDSRYTIYWPVAEASRTHERRAALAAADRDSLALDAMTVDKVAFGEQQPESDHGFRGEATEVAVDGDGRRARRTAAAMAVTLKDPDRQGHLLRVGYRLEGGPAAVAVRLGGVLLAEERWDEGVGGFDCDYGLPGPLTEEPRAGELELEFTALDGRPTPGVTTVRLLRWAAP
ncbi:glycoside hydrolase family 127 protein [Glycomyces sp. TRM65418]|uniref:glycoside hydrolase family 127 protein n=1 Tax=Glycomyces sp. TRM65418 TaxID=2867006 RepID=UPI001CE536D2|nr:beta-L-arabinofuranosidase domain-containing protein [Glycomyces sp. TRM65418]MCC3765329.1 glycoside hydrolase family 127 protein [Glycomyces sp. TRM65418]QZD54946.1 glycoside hydrolase family 127 protein [Glycomyces sp. TRM65418]